jgi:hypothetical protein
LCLVSKSKEDAVSRWLSAFWYIRSSLSGVRVD